VACLDFGYALFVLDRLVVLGGGTVCSTAAYKTGKQDGYLNQTNEAYFLGAL
jgi:hypothetical protein